MIAFENTHKYGYVTGSLQVPCVRLGRVAVGAEGGAGTLLEGGVIVFADFIPIVAFMLCILCHTCTEKIVSAFLAGAVPIYWGSNMAQDIFNPRSFVYVESPVDPTKADHDKILAGLQQGIKDVLAVVADLDGFDEIQKERTIFQHGIDNYFSWHRRVHVELNSTKLRDQIIELVNQQQPQLAKLLEAFYAHMNANKIATTPKILKHFEGREGALIAKLEKAYGIGFHACAVLGKCEKRKGTLPKQEL